MPHDELPDADLVCERDQDGEVERGFLGAVRQIHGAREAGLVRVPKQGESY